MALPSRKVFIASSVFFAFVDRVHPKHETAGAFFRYFGLYNYRLFTDTTTLIMTYNQIYKEISPSLGKDFLRTIYVSDINIIYPDESDTKVALKALVNYRSTDLSFSDALMAVLADRRGIPEVCTFDYLHTLFGLSVFYLPI